MKTCPLFFNVHVQNTPSIRHFWRHIDAIWQVSPALLTFRRHLPVTKADVLLTFCTYQVLYAKKVGGKNCRGELARWRIDCMRIDGDDEMREATCARTPTSKVPTRSRTSGWLFILWLYLWSRITLSFLKVPNNLQPTSPLTVGKINNFSCLSNSTPMCIPIYHDFLIY